MDYRSFAWLHLLPANTSFDMENVPRSFAAHLGSITNDAEGDRLAYLAWRSNGSALPDLAQYSSIALVNPGAHVATTLVQAGFSHTCTFATLPSLSDTRWLLPLDSVPVSLSSLRLVDPWRIRDRAKKRILSTVAHFGQLKRFGDVLLIARRTRSDLEVALEESVGHSPIFLGLKTGPPRTMRKTTVQVMHEGGGILAYAKLATTAGGRAVVNREVGTLQELSRHCELIHAVPRVLGTVESERHFASILSAGPDMRGPADFGESHHAFLSALARATGRVSTFRSSAMRRDIESKFDRVEQELPARWRSRLRASLCTLGATLGPRELLLSTAHRDFGQWNTRLNADGSLFVFDWDGAHREMTPLYDLIGFHYLDHANFRRQEDPIGLAQRLLDVCRRWAPEIDGVLAQYLLLAYLTEAALGRLIGALQRADLPRDEILGSIAELLDKQAIWLPDSPPMREPP